MHNIPRGTVSAIGIFDGVHRGHLEIINRVVRRAKISKADSLVITFSPHPYKIIKPQSNPPLLISLRHRLLMLERLGIGYCLVIDFDHKFAEISAQAFARDILFEGLKTSAVYVGEDFRFGRDQVGDIDMLKLLSRDLGFEVIAVPHLKYRGRVISSSWIRQEIKQGNLALVNKLLGRPLSIYGQVIKGDGRGKLLGFPTANLNIEHEAIPPMGVYAAKVYLENNVYSGLFNIGHRPTFVRKVKPETPLTIEVYLLDFEGSLYGEFLEVEFIKKIRPEKKFTKIPHLVKAMKDDALLARRILSRL